MKESPLPLKIRGLNLKAGEFRLSGIDLDIEAGGYLVMLGPTGSGKTLLVESVCGLRRPESGSIIIGSRESGNLDPASRRIGYLPQDYALLPFMTVGQNIAFGLRARRTPTRETREKVSQMLDLLSLCHLENRYPANLSGGEKQRTALARALAVDPYLLVMDEPLSALDENTGDRMMEEIQKLHLRRKTTTIHICHRLEEALYLGEKIALMKEGRIRQVGTAEDFLDRPADLFSARFFRLPNIVPGQVEEKQGRKHFFLQDMPVRETSLLPGRAWALLAPEKLFLSRQPAKNNDSKWFELQLRILPASRPLNRRGLSLGNGLVNLTLPGIYPADQWPVGEPVRVSIRREEIHLLPGDDPAQDISSRPNADPIVAR